ncbi:MAG TPA: prepilin-type N-terminal cleavage/methylation domain-containing protein [Planctomycetota bacterium]|nr:prepilin-type N-terminal cleavage/methylation domain-containing protein [Planctomycetota bacterium]
MSRRGFTLTELLVATIVFLVGFVSVFALFLGGMRMRKLAEDTTRASLAASCLIDEIRIDAGGGGAAGAASGPQPPIAYEGDGFAPFKPGSSDTDEGTATDPAPGARAPADNPLFPYKPIPGTWYRVMKCTDLEDSTTNAQTTVLKLDLLVVPFGSPDKRLLFSELDRRLALLDNSERSGATVETIAARLVQRGLAFRFVAVVTRRPSWLP